jgi:hypothetical protein
MDKINYPQLTKLNLFYNLVNKLVNLTSWLPNLFWDQGVKKNFMSKNLQRAASILSAVALISWLLIPSSSYIFAEGQCRAGQYNFTKTLYKGMKDPQVKDLQEMLAYCESSDIYPEKVVSGYYGSLTEAAVKRFQKKYGISPVGTFGPVTRAKANSLYGQGAQAQQPQTGATGQNQLLQQLLQQLASQNPALAALLQAFLQTQTGQQPQAQAPTGQVSVSLSPNSPMSGSLIAGSAQVPVLVFTISNGTSGDVTLTGLTFKKVGVVSDINITNGYLAEGNNILSQFSSFSNGVMTFSGNLLTIPAGQSKEVALRLDISTGATTGQTVSFQLTNVQVSGGQVSANLPLNGGTFTVTQVNNPSLAQISGFDYSGVTSEVDAGTEGVRIFAANMNVTNSPVKLMSIRFSITGSINPATDLANLVLRIDGQNAGSVSAPDASGKVYVDLGQGFQMGTGNHTLELYADVLGTPNRKFKVEILRPYDVVALDTQYNTYIPVGTPGPTPATEITVRQGQVVMNLASDSPTGNIAKGQSNVVLLKFKIRAAGEAVRIKWLPFKLEKLGGTAWNSGNIDNYIRNVALYDDAGNQVGSTISQLGVSGACGGVGATINANDLTCSFGSPSSHINYLLPANTTRTFTLRVDVQTNFDGSGLKGSIVAPSGGFGGNNIEGQISFQGSTSQTIQGAMLTISQTPFVGSPNTSVGTQTYVRGKSNAKIASFSLSASSAEGIEVSSLTFNVNDSTSGSGANLKLQNLYVKVGNNQWGNIVSTVSTANTNYSFSGVTPFTIPAGGSVIVDVYADILQTSATGTYSSVVDLTSASAVGVVSRASQSLSGTVNGQSVVVTGSGAFSSVSVDPSNPPSKQVVLGSTNQTLANFRFTADNNEDIRITDMDVEIVAVDTSTAPATFRNVRLLDGSSVVGWGTALSGPVATTSPGLGNPSTADSVFTSSFHFATPLVVPKNQTKTYTLAADVASYTESPSSHNVQYAARVASVTAVGNDSNESVPSATTTFANAQTTLRTKLSVASFTSLGSSSGRVRSASDEVAKLILNVDPAYNAEFRSVKLTFSGGAVSNYNASNAATDTASFQVELVDESNNVVASTSTLTETGVNTGVFVAQLNLSSPRIITAGQQDQLKLRVDSSRFNNVSQQTDALSIRISAKEDLVWREQGGNTDLVLEPGVVPLTVTVSYE